MSKIKVGDLVKVIVGDRNFNQKRYVGDTGIVTEIDREDSEGMPYLLRFRDGGTWWCAEVELVDNDDWRKLSDEEVKLVVRALDAWMDANGNFLAIDGALGLRDRLAKSKL
jgi:hypothetical protein